MLKTLINYVNYNYQFCENIKQNQSESFCYHIQLRICDFFFWNTQEIWHQVSLPFSEVF